MLLGLSSHVGMHGLVLVFKSINVPIFALGHRDKPRYLVVGIKLGIGGGGEGEVSETDLQRGGQVLRVTKFREEFFSFPDMLGLL